MGQDPFGRGLFDYYHGEEVTEIIEREDGFIDVTGGPADYFREYADWPDVEHQAIKYARGKVLDIGCGAGRHSLYLQERGLDVLGIDRSPLAVQVCKERGLRSAEPRSINSISSKLGIFDTLILMGNNFGLLANPKRARWLLKRFKAMTSESARIITTTIDIYRTKEKIHLKYHQFNRQRGRMAGQIRLRVRYKDLKDNWFDYLMVSRDEMEEILQGTGWEVSHFIDSDSPQYAAIIEKEQINSSAIS